MSTAQGRGRGRPYPPRSVSHRGSDNSDSEQEEGDRDAYGKNKDTSAQDVTMHTSKASEDNYQDPSRSIPRIDLGRQSSAIPGSSSRASEPSSSGPSLLRKTNYTAGNKMRFTPKMVVRKQQLE